MMKRILLLIPLILCLSLLFACGGSDAPSDDGGVSVPDNGGNDGDDTDLLEGITLSDASAVYDGRPHSLSVNGTLGEGITVEYEPASITAPAPQP